MRKFLRIIDKTKKRYNALLILRYLFAALSIIFITFSIFHFIYNLTSSGHYTELFLFALSLKIFIALLILYYFLKLVKEWNNSKKSARMLDRINSDKYDTYQNALELHNEYKNFKKNILERIYDEADKKAVNQDIKIKQKNFTNLVVITILSCLTLLSVYLFNQESFIKSYKFFNFQIKPEEFHKKFVEVRPGNYSILKNQDLTIEVVEPELNIRHQLFYKIENQWREETLFDYKRTFYNLDFSFDYYIKTPYAVSDTYAVKVFELPIVENIDLKYNYPNYTGLTDNIVEDSNGHIKALKQTVVTVSIKSNNPLKEANLIFSDGNLLKMDRQGKDKFKTQFHLEKSQTYHFRLLDILNNKSPKIQRMITAVDDEKPEINITEPAADTILSKNMLLPIKLYASDDFGLQALKLKYYINSGESQKIDIQNKFTQKIINIDYLFDLSKQTLIPGDRVTYWFEISDNSPENQLGVTKKYLLKFPSVAEIYQEIEKTENEKKEIMQTALEKSKEMQKAFEEKRREVMRKEEVDWEDKEELKEFLEKQKDLNKNIDDISKNYKNMIEKFEKNRALTGETLEKMKKIQELMEEIASEELRKTMEEMQQKLEKMDKNQLKKAMKDFKFSMENFSKQLEQTLKLLENIKKEQALQKALEISKEMEKMQTELQKRTSQNSNQEELMQDQKKIAQKNKELDKQISNLDSLFSNENEQDLKNDLKKLQQRRKQEKLNQDIEKSMQNLQNNKKEQAMQYQQSATQKMQQTSQSLQEMMDKMSNASSMAMGNALNKTIKRLLIFSNEHEKSAAKYVSDPFSILPKQIAIFEGIDKTLKELYSIPMIMLMLGPKFSIDANNTFKEYRNMFQYINDAKKGKINHFLNNIQKGINLMVFDLMQAQKNMQKNSMGGGMQSLMQMMKNMGQQQMMMNMMTQQILQQMGQNGRISKEMREQIQRLAKDEQRLAENLKRALQTNPEAQKQANALEKMIEDLESIARNLKMNKIDKKLIDKQEKILSRLLDAQKSIHKREFSRERKSEISEKRKWNLPEELKNRFDKFESDALLRDDKNNYSKEYMELIEEYLRQLNKNYNKLRGNK